MMPADCNVRCCHADLPIERLQLANVGASQQQLDRLMPSLDEASKAKVRLM